MLNFLVDAFEAGDDGLTGHGEVAVGLGDGEALFLIEFVEWMVLGKGALGAEMGVAVCEGVIFEGAEGGVEKFLWIGKGGSEMDGKLEGICFFFGKREGSMRNDGPDPLHGGVGNRDEIARVRREDRALAKRANACVFVGESGADDHGKRRTRQVRSRGPD